jgi:hypothetical protein
MLLYTDILSGDEMFSDAFPVLVHSFFSFRFLTDQSTHSKTVDDIVYEVDCQMITIKAGADIDIGQTIQLLKKKKCFSPYFRC